MLYILLNAIKLLWSKTGPSRITPDTISGRRCQSHNLCGIWTPKSKQRFDKINVITLMKSPTNRPTTKQQLYYHPDCGPGPIAYFRTGSIYATTYSEYATSHKYSQVYCLINIGTQTIAIAVRACVKERRWTPKFAGSKHGGFIHAYIHLQAQCLQ